MDEGWICQFCWCLAVRDARSPVSYNTEHTLSATLWAFHFESVMKHARLNVIPMSLGLMKANRVGITRNSSPIFYCIIRLIPQSSEAEGQFAELMLTWLAALFTDEDGLQTGATAFTLFRLIGGVISSDGGECQCYDVLWHGFGLWTRTAHLLCRIINAARAFTHEFIALASFMQLSGAYWYHESEMDKSKYTPVKRICKRDIKNDKKSRKKKNIFFFLVILYYISDATFFFFF